MSKDWVAHAGYEWAGALSAAFLHSTFNIYLHDVKPWFWKTYKIILCVKDLYSTQNNQNRDFNFAFA